LRVEAKSFEKRLVWVEGLVSVRLKDLKFDGMDRRGKEALIGSVAETLMHPSSASQINSGRQITANQNSGGPLPQQRAMMLAPLT